MLCCLRSLWTGSALSRRNCAGTPSYFLLSDFYLLGWLRKRSSQVFWQQWAFYHHCRIFRSYSGSPGTIANMIKKCCFQSCQIVGQCKVESNLQDGWIFLNVTTEVWKTPVYAVVVGREWLREKVLLGHTLHLWDRRNKILIQRPGIPIHSLILFGRPGQI